MTFRSLFVLGIVLLATSCNRAPKNNEAIRQAVIDHLTKNTGLDVNSMKIDVTSVQYHDNLADALVSFQPKNMPGGGMSMTYTLESKGNKWTVRKRAGNTSSPHPGAEMPSGGGMGQGQMPPGHPSMGGAEPSATLPPGHPTTTTKPETPAKK